jgi:hypothetical protein
MDPSDRLVWAGTTSFEIEGQRIVVQSSDRHLHEILRRALTTHVLESDARPCCTYSVSVSDSGVYALHRGPSLVIRARKMSRVIGTLLAQLSAHGAATASSDTLHAYALAFLRNDAAVIIPWDLFCQVAVLRRRIEAAGWELDDGPVLIDRRTGELVLQANSLQIDWTPFGGHREISRASMKNRLPSGGRRSIVGWIFVGDGPAVTRAGANLRAVQTIANRSSIGPQEALDGVALALHGAEICTLRSVPAPDLAEPLLAALRQFDDGMRP